MRIAVNTRFLLPGKLEGLGWYTHELVSRMVHNHPECEFVFFFDRPYQEEFIYGPNVKPIVVSPPARHPILWYWWFELSLPRALRKSGAAVFFSPDSYLSLRTRVPTLMAVHDMLPFEQPDQIPPAPRMYYRHFLPKYLGRANKIITVSKYTKGKICELAGVPEDKISVLYNAARDSFKPLTLADKMAVREDFSNGKPYFLYTGSIHPRKNVDGLIRAFDHFKASSGSDIQLVLAGRMAWQTESVERALEESAFKQDIIRPGYVSEADLARLMGGAEALVLFSKGEGFGLPLVEAMKCQTPIVCSNTSALPEVAGDAAILVNPESVDSMASGLRTVLEGKEPARLKERMEEQIKLFDWDRSAEELFKMLLALRK